MPEADFRPGTPDGVYEHGLKTVEPINARSMLEAASAAAAAATDRRPPNERRQRLSPAALAVVNQKVRSAYSPIVIAGLVRLADFVLLSFIGIALYLGYMVPLAGFRWEYVAAIFAMTLTAVICFQAADIYDWLGLATLAYNTLVALVVGTPARSRWTARATS